MDLERILENVERRFPGFRQRHAGPVTLNEDGWDSLVLDLNGEYILRIPRRAAVLAAYPRELALLEALAPLLPIPIPQPDLACLDSPLLEDNFMGYPRLPGEGLEARHLSPALAAQIGQLLTTLHSLPPEVARRGGAPIFSPQEWREQYIEFFAWARAEALPRLPEGSRNDWTARWQAYLDGPATAFRPALIHADLCGDHLLVDPQAGWLAGVIDWEDACVGDPALDFTGLLAIAGPAFVQQVLQSYLLPAGPSSLERAAFYYAIIPFHELRFALETGNAAMLAEALDLLPQTR